MEFYLKFWEEEGKYFKIPEPRSANPIDAQTQRTAFDADVPTLVTPRVMMAFVTSLLPDVGEDKRGKPKEIPGLTESESIIIFEDLVRYVSQSNALKSRIYCFITSPFDRLRYSEGIASMSEK